MNEAYVNLQVPQESPHKEQPRKAGQQKNPHPAVILMKVNIGRVEILWLSVIESHRKAKRSRDKSAAAR